MRISWNGEPLDEFHPAKQRIEKAYPLPAAKQGPDEYTELRISIDKFYIPREAEKGATDKRRLAFKLTRLTWAEKDSVVPVAAFPPPAEPVPEITAVPMLMRRWKTFAVLGVAISCLVVWLAIRQRRRDKSASESSG
jgi:hypothetical protein